MNTTLTFRTANRVLALAASALLVVGASCTSDPVSVEPTPVTPTSSAQRDESTITSTSTFTSTSTSTSTPTPTVSASIGSSLTDEEIAGLMWMREEEQLAYDVYVVLGELWNLRIFDNISSAETAHIDAVSGLLDLYGLDDPAAGNDAGTFTDPELQRLYDQLVADGSRSLEAALEVGAFIEEVDLVDLAAHSAATDTPEISRVYANLEQGSRNHLRAFFSQLESRGVTYTPTQLDAATFDAVVSSDMERGPGS
jgi:hypothetical protein